MTMKVKFLNPWRGYPEGAVADLSPERAAEVEASGDAEIIGGPAKLEPTVAKPGAATVNVNVADGPEVRALVESLKQKLLDCGKECADWKAKVGQAAADRDAALARLSELGEQRPAVEPVDSDASELFPELDLPEVVKRKMAAAGWKTLQDVIDYGSANGGLQSAEGIGKAYAQAIGGAIEKHQQS